MLWIVVMLALPAAAGAQGGYADLVLSTPGLTHYWRLDETSGTVAADAKAQAAGSYLGGPGLGARGALSAGGGSSARFDGIDDEMQSGGGAVAAVEGAWSRVQKSAGAPVVYVALASHASYFASGVNSRGLYPDDYHRGGGYQVRPALEIVSQSTPFMTWRGRWGASSSSPAAPRRQAKWGDPNAFNSGASACTVGTAQAAATASALRAGAEVAEPELTVTRTGARGAQRGGPGAPALIAISGFGLVRVRVLAGATGFRSLPEGFHALL